MSSFSKLCLTLYGINNNRIRKLIINVINRFENGELFSKTLREIFIKYHDIDIGIYSHGACFVPGQIDRQTTIGNYCSMAPTTRVMNRNHPMEFISMHGFFFRPELKFCYEDNIEHIPLNIEHDVWTGHNSIIMPHVKNIGTGAVIGAGAVVNKDIPPYAVVVGNPARIVKYRFSEDVIRKLLESKWWEKSIEKLGPEREYFTRAHIDANNETN
jgi:acetyltransferase-like isoleucine patch superfamily enzyme